MNPRLPMLALDTSGPHCAVHVAGAAIVNMHEPMKRGQAERLMPMCDEALEQAGLQWQDLNSLAVGVGPGNFTGIRIGVSAVRGLALALNIPAVGVSGFRQLLQGVNYATRVLVSLPAPRDQAYVQLYLGHEPLGPPKQIIPGDHHPDLEQPGLTVVGHAAAEIADGVGATPGHDVVDRPEMIAANIAHAALMMMDRPDYTPDRPAPLYVRAADAAPPKDPAPVILP